MNKTKITIIISLFIILSIIIIAINQITSGKPIFVDVENDNIEEEKDDKKDEKNEIELKFGTLLNLNKNCEYDNDGNCIKKIVVIKAKITPSYSNKSTIDQNYYNVEGFIKNDNGIEYDEIQYWAVADITDDSEEKVMSFTIDKELIQKIYDNEIVANQIGNFVDDLWILPSLEE